MKKIIIGTALAALMASPALAQAYNPSYGTGNVMPTPPDWRSQSTATMGGEAYDYEPSQATLKRLRGVRDEALPAASTNAPYGYYQ